MLIDEVKEEQQLPTGKNPSQLEKYYNLALYYAKKQGLDADDAVKCYLLCPKYKYSHYANIGNVYPAGAKYEVKTYEDLANCISQGDYEPLSLDKHEIIHDLKRAIQPYTKDQNTYYVEQVCGRFINRIKELKLQINDEVHG